MKKREYPKPETTKRARGLRQQQTVPEKLLWVHFRSRKLSGVKFRRQFPIGPYIADFCCREHMLVIELDGDSHADRFGYDKQRQEYLESKGYRVIRIANDDVIDDIEAVLEWIKRHLK